MRLWRIGASVAAAVWMASAPAGCAASRICNGRELQSVKTADEEAVAMSRFWKECRPLTAAAVDEAGHPVSFGDADWTARVHRVTLSGGEAPFEHRVLDGKNVLILLNE